MNYIRHLNAFFSVVRSDKRLTSSHVSLYMALFQYWNFNRFQNPFPVYRQTMMELSKIGSKNTYHKCIKELHLAEYILCHPAVTKYQPAKISMIHLDKKMEESQSLQMVLFNPQYDPLKSELTHHYSGGKPEEKVSNDIGAPQVPNSTGTSTDIGTKRVPELPITCPNIGTAPVPEKGHYIKLNRKERETPAQKIFAKNKKIQKEINSLTHVPDMGHINHFIIPALSEVIDFFKANKYPGEEANKFFNHYKALGWQIQGKTPIRDWQPLVHKWMTNENKWNNQKKTPVPAKQEKDIKIIYHLFMQGKKVFHLITSDHFHELNLNLTDAILQKAWQERMSQLMGSNNFTSNQLLQAYESGNVENELIKRDHSNLLILAKRIAVMNHFKVMPQQ